MKQRTNSWIVLTLAALTLTCAAEPRADVTREGLAKATFAGGCFWCVESAFDGVPGVVAAVSGYTGGDEVDPTYEQVSARRTGHVEAVEVSFDPAVIGYEDLLNIFWRQIDPTDDGGQFADRGPQYRSFIFHHDDEQKTLAEKSRNELAASGRFDAPIVIAVVPAEPFYRAEEYHQDYHRKHPEKYKGYRHASGRTPFLERVWGADAHIAPVKKKAEHRYVKPDDDKLRETLTAVQYHVTQQEGTEVAFSNEYWDNKREGIYVDVVSGQPLFSSLDKFDSRTGWPSFTQPVDESAIVERVDRKLLMPRTEVRSSGADSHLGHLFPDGPGPTGQRYCVNSAALRFVPKEKLEEEGYGEYLSLFEKSAN